jgi:undecaprenyl-diphosphatase
MVERNRKLAARLARLREHRAILLLAVLFLFFLVLSSVARSAWLLQWDHGVSLAVQRYRSPVLDVLAEAISLGGDAALLVGVGALAVVVLRLQNRRVAARFVVAALLLLPLNVALKAWVGRPRPAGDVQVLMPVNGLSFPSGHSMSSSLVFGLLAFLVWVHTPDPRRRLRSTAVLGLMPVFVGLSRIYLGAHWLSDVIGGWTVGLFLLLVLVELYQVIARDEVAAGSSGPT